MDILKSRKSEARNSKFKTQKYKIMTVDKALSAHGYFEGRKPRLIKLILRGKIKIFSAKCP
jgi:hypothetical protein